MSEDILSSVALITPRRSQYDRLADAATGQAEPIGWLAPAFYERNKLISYPRTDSRHLSQDVAATAPGIVAAVSPSYQKQLAAGTGKRPLGKRFVDDSKVSDHHATIPKAVS